MATKKKSALPAGKQTSGRGGKRSTSFKPGQSGNPLGGPKKTEEQKTLEMMCRDKTPAALETILSIMVAGDNERNKLAAAQYIIDRGWGKAAQIVRGEGENGSIPLSLSIKFV